MPISSSVTLDWVWPIKAFSAGRVSDAATMRIRIERRWLRSGRLENVLINAVNPALNQQFYLLGNTNN